MATARTLESEHPTSRDGRDETAVAAELDAVSARALALLRDQQPQLFDARGRLRQGALRQFLLARTGGKHLLTKEEIDALAGADRLPDASG